jgi:hypothetical protein
LVDPKPITHQLIFVIGRGPSAHGPCFFGKMSFTGSGLSEFHL